MDEPLTSLSARDAESVFAHNGVRFTELGLELPDSMPREVWGEILVTVARIYRGSPWAVGDALNYGDIHYGETYAQWSNDTGLSPERLANLKWVAGRFPMYKRREALSFEHHAAVANLFAEDPSLAEELLEQAEAEHLSSKELAYAVRISKETSGDVYTRTQRGSAPQNVSQSLYAQDTGAENEIFQALFKRGVGVHLESLSHHRYEDIEEVRDTLKRATAFSHSLRPEVRQIIRTLSDLLEAIEHEL